MFFIDSWVWIEFFFQNQKAEKAYEIISQAEQNGGVIDTLVLMEVKTYITKAYGKETAKLAIDIIANIKNVKTVPVFSEIAETAADIRLKYYSKETPLSSADAIHIATALYTHCTKIYTGDSDFKNIQEIKTIII